MITCNQKIHDNWLHMITLQNEIDYIMITCNQKMHDNWLHMITLQNVIDYS